MESSLQTNIEPLVNEETTIEKVCRESDPVRSDLTPAEIEARRDACARLLNAAPLFRQKYNAISAGLSHLDLVYKHEKDIQEKLLESAQKIE